MKQPRVVLFYLIGLSLLMTALAARAQGPEPLVEPPSCSTRCLPGIACYAVPSNCGPYCGYRVGGGCWRGDRALPTDGTWGWDYCGYLHKYVNLRWCHCRRCQGGAGAYRTVGPNLSSRSSP